MFGRVIPARSGVNLESELKEYNKLNSNELGTILTLIRKRNVRKQYRKNFI